MSSIVRKFHVILARDMDNNWLPPNTEHSRQVSFQFKRGGFFRGWGLILVILVTVYFGWRIFQALTGSMPAWVGIVSSAGIIYVWYRILSPVKAIEISSNGRVRFIRGLGSREVWLREISSIRPWLNIAKKDFVLRHAYGWEFLFEDLDTVVEFAQAIKKVNPSTEIKGLQGF